ncbi:hypothetical protein P8C59_008850 [Phyllachora maydis]|uniref:Uncharacterized protein n=1 Tax=Phyllachora maydis TaxID=1825666 RepID=A0AAD9ID58_9PEZI|nr:hypothetical protein P8C59_008850 [Phyllachora maydis]
MRCGACCHVILFSLLPETLASSSLTWSTALLDRRYCDFALSVDGSTFRSCQHPFSTSSPGRAVWLTGPAVCLLSVEIPLKDDDAILGLCLIRRGNTRQLGTMGGDINMTITGWKVKDVRFPTSLDKTGSDAMNAARDYSAAYCILETDSEYVGHGMTFSIGRGNDLVCAAIDHVADRIKGRTLSSLTARWGKTWRHLVNDSHLRWIGPEQGVIHLALGSVMNAIWDL